MTFEGRADVLVAAPIVEPITTAQAKAHLRVTSSTEDALIASLIKAARGHAEDYCTKALMLQSRALVLDAFPCWDPQHAWPVQDREAIEIFRGPLRAVQSVKYLDGAGILQTLATSAYRVDKYSTPARITPAYGTTWPTTYQVASAVLVNYTAGHLLPFTADAPTDVLSVAGHGFVDTDIARVSTLGGSLPGGLAVDTNYYVRDAAADTLKLSVTSGGAAIDITAAGTPPNVLGILPSEISAAMLLIIGHLFENRERASDAELFEMPFAVKSLLGPKSIVRF